MKAVFSLPVLFLSRASVALSGFLLIPLYLSKLGDQALGLLTLLMSIQTCMMVFDLGLSTLSTTRAAQYVDDSIEFSMNALLKFSEFLYVSVGLLFSLLLMAFFLIHSEAWIWKVSIEGTPKGWGVFSLCLGCLSLAVVWPQNYYSAVLNGLHRQTRLAMIVIICTALRFIILFATLHLSPNLLAVFVVFFCSALFQTVWMKRAATIVNQHRSMKLSWHEFKRNFKSSVDINLLAIAVIGTLLGQGDKIFLSTILSAADFAAYAVAAMLCGSLYMLINPLYSLCLPHFSLVLKNDCHKYLRQSYSQASELAAIVILPIGALLTFFAPSILKLWLDDLNIIHTASPVMLWLALGTTAHGLLYVPYSLQMAAGWTSLALKINFFILLISIPMLYLACRNWGATGAAASWALINFAFLLIWPALMHRRLITGMAAHWFFRYVLIPTMMTWLVMWLFQFFILNKSENMLTTLFVMFFAYMTSILTLLMILPIVRKKILIYLCRSKLNINQS